MRARENEQKWKSNKSRTQHISEYYSDNANVSEKNDFFVNLILFSDFLALTCLYDTGWYCNGVGGSMSSCLSGTVALPQFDSLF